MTPAQRRRAAGAFGLAYVVLAGVEGMDALLLPAAGADAAEIRAAYADRALAVVTALAGVAALACYVAFALLLAARAPHRRLVVAGALAGPALALAGIAAAAPLVLGTGGDAAARDGFAASHDLRLLAGPCMALALACLAAAPAIPRPLGRAARPVAAALALTPFAPYEAALVAFGLHALWIAAASLWLCGGPALAPRERIRQGAFLALVIAAGGVGLGLLAVPAAAGSFFAWALAPAPLAAFAGGVYVGSALVYATALRLPAAASRPLEAAAAVLSVSVLAVTLTHLEPFDLGRLQAWAWLVLFAAFSAITVWLVATGRRPPGRDAPLGPAARAGFAGAAAVLLAAAAVLWAAHPGLPPLGGRFAGSWAAMLGTAAAWPALSGRARRRAAPGARARRPARGRARGRPARGRLPARAPGRARRARRGRRRPPTPRPGCARRGRPRSSRCPRRRRPPARRAASARSTAARRARRRWTSMT